MQIYRLIKEWTAWDIARRAAFAFFGIFSGTEENPEFIQSMTYLPNDASICCIDFLRLSSVFRSNTSLTYANRCGVTN